MTAAVAAIAMSPRSGRADGAIDAWAEWLVSQGAYRGPLVPFPDAVPRPAAAVVQLRSTSHPVAVQAGPDVAPEQAERALHALEVAWQQLHDAGGPLPLPDGGHGGTLEFDVYLARRARPAGAVVEHPAHWRDTDSATAYAWLDPDLADDALPACALWALAEGGLLGLDPAEATRWRRASAAALVYLTTGSYACGDDATEAQRHPERGFLDAREDIDTREGDATALYLAALAERHGGDQQGARFLHALWELGRQASGDARLLHGEPDLPMVITQALTRAGETPDQVAVDVAVARYFAGTAERRRHAAYPAFAALPPDAAVPVVESRPFSALPHHLPAAEPPLWPWGSAYVRVDTRGAGEGSRLKVWLRGERGARWSLVAVRLAEDGRELGRVEAPARTRNPDAYLPVELSIETAAVVLVVTHLPATPLPKRSATPPPLPGPRSFRLILDR